MQIQEFGGTDKVDSDFENKANCLNFTTSTSLAAEPKCKMHALLNSFARQPCDKQNNCEFSVPIKEIKNACSILNNVQNLYVSYHCFDKYIELGNSLISRNTLNYLIVFIDFAGILILFVTIIIIRCDYSKLNKAYKESNKLVKQ